MMEQILAQLKDIITLWGIVGTVVAVFSGPILVQRIKHWLPPVCTGKKKTKRRRITLGLLSAAVTFGVSYWALNQQYADFSAIMLTAVLVTVFQITIIEMLFVLADKKYPKLAKILSEEMWLPKALKK